MPYSADLIESHQIYTYKDYKIQIYLDDGEWFFDIIYENSVAGAIIYSSADNPTKDVAMYNAIGLIEQFAREEEN